MRVGIETTNQKYMFIEDGACKRYFPIKDNKLDGDAFVQSLNSHLEKQNCQIEKLKADIEMVREVNRLLSDALTKRNLLIKEKDEEIARLKTITTNDEMDVRCYQLEALVKYYKAQLRLNTQRVCETIKNRASKRVYSFQEKTFWGHKDYKVSYLIKILDLNNILEEIEKENFYDSKNQ